MCQCVHAEGIPGQGKRGETPGWGQGENPAMLRKLPQTGWRGDLPAEAQGRNEDGGREEMNGISQRDSNPSRAPRAEL